MQVCRRVLCGWKATNYAHDGLNEEMDAVWQTMHDCWQREGGSRPSLKTIIRYFEEREGSESSGDGMDQSSSDYDDDGYHYNG